MYLLVILSEYWTNLSASQLSLMFRSVSMYWKLHLALSCLCSYLIVRGPLHRLWQKAQSVPSFPPPPAQPPTKIKQSSLASHIPFSWQKYDSNLIVCHYQLLCLSISFSGMYTSMCRNSSRYWTIILRGFSLKFILRHVNLDFCEGALAPLWQILVRCPSSW